MDIYYAIFIFFTTHLAYHFHRFFGYNANLKPIESPRHKWYNNNKQSQIILIAVSALLAGFCLFKIGFNLCIYLLPVCILSGLYNIKIGQFKGLRHIPFLKTFLIALVWAFSLSVPLMFINPQTPALFLFIRNLLFILAITLPFDIRDLNRDPAWLKTLPQVIGVNATKNFSIALLFSFLVNGWLFNKSGFFLKADFVTVIITSFMIYSTKPDQNDKLYLLGLDGSIIIRFILILLNQL